MGALIVLLILIPVVIIILLLSLYSKASSQQQSLHELTNKLDDVTNQLKEVNKTLQQNQKGEIPVITRKEETVPAQPVTRPVEFIPVTPPVKEEIIPPVKKEDIPPVKEEKKEPAPRVFEEYKKPAPVSTYNFEADDIDERKLEEKLVSSKSDADIERFIGENLANKIGIAVLVLGISFFVKYAIDKNWINETGRVGIGLLCGAILIGLAHRIRNSYRSFSSVLVGGGLTVFYFTIAYAFHQYHLIGQQPAFIIMVVITAFAVLLSLYYERQELAILATIGGFITPFLVTTGKENYIALFTYLCILNGG